MLLALDSSLVPLRLSFLIGQMKGQRLQEGQSSLVSTVAFPVLGAGIQ